MGFQVGFPALKGPANIDYWFPPTPYSYFEAVRGRDYRALPDVTFVANGTFPGDDAYFGGVLLPDRACLLRSG